MHKDAIGIADTYRGMLSDKTKSLTQTLEAAQKIIDNHRDVRTADLENYSGAFRNIRKTLTLLSDRVKLHEAANVIERSLVKTLQGNIEEAIRMCDAFTMEGLDPTGEHRKTVKTATLEIQTGEYKCPDCQVDKDTASKCDRCIRRMGNSNEKEIIGEGIQTLKEVPQEHQWQAERGEAGGREASQSSESSIGGASSSD